MLVILPNSISCADRIRRFFSCVVEDAANDKQRIFAVFQPYDSGSEISANLLAKVVVD